MSSFIPATVVDQNLSLFIPHVYSNISTERVAKSFEDQRFGKVKRVDRVAQQSCRDGRLYYSAYIHFEFWNETVTVANFQARVVDTEKEAHLVYEDPWFWIVLENKTARRVPNAPKVRIQLEKPVLARDTASDFDYEPIELLAPKQQSTPLSLVDEAQVVRLVDADYVSHIEWQLEQERFKLSNLENELIRLENTVNNKIDIIEFLNHEVKALQDEIAFRFKHVPEGEDN